MRQHFQSYYAKIPGILEMGIVRLEQYGLLRLHWHRGNFTGISQSLSLMIKMIIKSSAITTAIDELNIFVIFRII